MLCYGCLGRDSKLNVVVGFCGFPRFFNEVPEIPGMQLGVHSRRRNQFAPMSKNISAAKPTDTLPRCEVL